LIRWSRPGYSRSRETNLRRPELRHCPCPCPDYQESLRPSPNAILIASAGCAIVGLTPEGAAVYSVELLVKHFDEHEGMGDLDEDREEASAALEWLETSVLRGLEYLAAHSSHSLPPVIMDEEYQVYPYKIEGDDDY